VSSSPSPDVRPLPLGPAGSVPTPPSERPLLRALLHYWDTLLTPRGRYLLVVCVAFALLGVDTRRSQAFVLFAGAAGLLSASSLLRLRPRPRFEWEAIWPERATAGKPVALRVQAFARGDQALPACLRLFLRRPRWAPGRVRAVPSERLVAVVDNAAQTRFELLFERRGRYVLRGPSAAQTDALALLSGQPVSSPDHTLYVHPSFQAMDSFDLPVGRRYQPGGIPLSSSTGDAIEFVNTREYRSGDPLKHIHWRSFARHGQPVVKEFQEEYFCRIALVIDTFAPRRSSAATLLAFEAALSLSAAIADVFSRSEYLVDVLAAGPDLYTVSAGRSLAYLENILDVLACLEPCREPPFETLAPALEQQLGQTSTVVAVLLDWDERREVFLRRLRSHGVATRGLIVRAGATTRPWQPAAEDLGLEQRQPEGLRA